MENNISMTNLILWVGGQKKDFFLDMNLKILQLVTQIKDIQIYQFIKEDNYDKFSQESINIKECRAFKFNASQLSWSPFAVMPPPLPPRSALVAAGRTSAPGRTYKSVTLLSTASLFRGCGGVMRVNYRLPEMLQEAGG